MKVKGKMKNCYFLSIILKNLTGFYDRAPQPNLGLHDFLTTFFLESFLGCSLK
jgi:hypothetical protein